MPSENYICVKCGLNTVASGQNTHNKKTGKRRIEICDEVLVKYFNEKKIDIKKYKFVCISCYRMLNNILANSVSFMAHVKKTNGFQEKRKVSEQPVQNMIIFSDEKCKTCTGFDISEFDQIYESIKSNWLHKVSIRDLLFVYLSRLRLGI